MTLSASDMTYIVSGGCQTLLTHSYNTQSVRERRGLYILYLSRAPHRAVPARVSQVAEARVLFHETSNYVTRTHFMNTEKLKSNTTV